MSSAQTSAHGVLPRYVDLAYHCREQVVEGFSQLFQQFLQNLPDGLLKLADHAESNTVQTNCLDARQEILCRREEMLQGFCNELMAGFENFILGYERTSEQTDSNASQKRRLSLIEKEIFELELAFDTVANSACVHFSELLFTLNQRLAVINNGFKPGERSAALPGSPHHLCNAYRCALSSLSLPLDTGVKISLIEAFDDAVLRQAEPIYQKYNQILIEAGILPNLEEHPVYLPEAGPAPKPQGEAEEAKSQFKTSTTPEPEKQEQVDEKPTTPEEILEQEIFQNISQLLRQRRGTAGSPPPGVLGGRITDLIDALKALRGDGSSQVTAPLNIAHYPLEQIRAEFQAQLSRLTKLIEQYKIEHTEADVIELVGMLFEQVLNDPNLPDSVKALLSYLHTPYLKVALLDRKFFFKCRHPARRLLNVLTQAGALCNATDKNEHTLYARMRETVNRVLTEFDGNIELFERLLAEFEEFLRQYQARARLLEQRAIAKAKGQEKLREARQTVAQELAQLVRGQVLPKAAERLLFGPWANLLVLLHLRKDSETFRHYLEMTKDILWSVQPQTTLAQQRALRQKLPGLMEEIKMGLALLGDPDNNTERLLAELAACQQVALANDSTNLELPEPKGTLDPNRYPHLQDIDLEDFLRERPKPVSPEMESLLDRLRQAKLGTWFEFHDVQTGVPIRAKLSWYSPKTGYYIFVNQAGIQTRAMGLKKLATEILEGRAKLLELERRPFVERALHRIYQLLSSRA
ncbi:MAG: DUF1631 domain-containing protein [Methylohalobius sp.]|nr:DUF1631 domain-containing protein [Methylohalobius sp.]